MTQPSPERARLAAALRELRSRTGLSMARLGTKTTYSKSSWERYLNGKALPPRQAVQDLCRLAGEPEGRCLALWEIAESQWSGRATAQPRPDTGRGTPPEGTPVSASPSSPTVPRPAPSPAPSSPEVPPAAGHRSAVMVAVLASVCAVAVGGVAVALFLLPRLGDASSSPPPAPSASGPGCRGAACEGRDPTQMRCAAEPDTVASHRTAGGAWMELRHSKECGTSWARMWGAKIGDRIEMAAGGRAGRVRGAEVEDDLDAAAYVYTPMTTTRPGTVVRACFRPAAGGARECFEGRVR